MPQDFTTTAYRADTASHHCLRISMGGCAPYVSRFGMFKSSTWMAWNFPAGGPKIPLRLFSNLPSRVSWVMFADLCCVDTVSEPRRRRRGVMRRHLPKVQVGTLRQHVCAENVIVSGINSEGAERPSHLLTPCKYWEMLTVLPVPVSPTIMQW